MGGTTDILDLGRLNLSSGEGKRLDLSTSFDPIELAGQSYTSAPVPVRLDVARTTGGGWSLRMRYEATLEGPCMRCLEPANRVMKVDAREVHQPSGGGDLSSPYIDDDDLNLRDWVHDALTLDLEGQVLCRDDCAGLCAECGQNLNEHPHEHEQPVDARWSKLSELKLK